MSVNMVRLHNLLDVFADCASQINLRNHQYIDAQTTELSIEPLTDDYSFSYEYYKGSLWDLINEIGGSLTKLPKNPCKTMMDRVFYRSLNEMLSRIERKASGVCARLFHSKESATLLKTAQEIRRRMSEFSMDCNDPIPANANEREMRLAFYAREARKIGITEAATTDLEVIKIVSQRIFECTRSYEEYAQGMTAFFEGAHLLFEEDGMEALSLQRCTKLLVALTRRDDTCLRGSSHYDHGTTDYQTGGPVPTHAQLAHRFQFDSEKVDQDVVENPQYEIVGPQVKALVFGSVRLAKKADGKPIFGKTFKQVMKEEGHNCCADSEVIRGLKKYTWMQTEWTPDSSSILTMNFWKHRVFSFLIYFVRNTLRFEKPNVGPYGYGFGDKTPLVFSVQRDAEGSIVEE